ncbi:MAG: D-alanine--D-alanine ligase [Candidatus Nomurabacteria bacterium]|jgi:D-alanine-D-alanine ligase|nr:D-alanine--D-alanine ligase [Candidatus Nomurabacteria bacterium]
MNKTVAVFFGGKSTEHDISIISALVAVVKPLQLLGHTVIPVYITKMGEYFSGERFLQIETYRRDRLPKALVAKNHVTFDLSGGLSVIGGTLRKTRTKIDVVFPVLHGTFGEDGSLMGLLRMASVPFVGCDMEASVVAMNKVLAKQVAESCGVLTPKFVAFKKRESIDEMVRRVKDVLKYPVFVKPPHLGSSIGVSKVKNDVELKNAIEVALCYDELVLVEEEVDNLTEVTLPIIGNGDDLELGLLERPLVKGEFDFEAKYLHGGKKGGQKTGAKGAQGYSELPAKLPPKLYAEAENVGRLVYERFGLSGIARIDLLIDTKSKKVYFNEINPMPGSLYAHNFAAKGVSNVQLVEKLLNLALSRYEAEKKVERAFKSSFLEQF